VVAKGRWASTLYGLGVVHATAINPQLMQHPVRDFLIWCASIKSDSIGRFKVNLHKTSWGKTRMHPVAASGWRNALGLEV
jgi:hypothetical protein